MADESPNITDLFAITRTTRSIRRLKPPSVYRLASFVCSAADQLPYGWVEPVRRVALADVAYQDWWPALPGSRLVSVRSASA
jgi:hypothetical protein